MSGVKKKACFNSTGAHVGLARTATLSLRSRNSGWLELCARQVARSWRFAWRVGLDTMACEVAGNGRCEQVFGGRERVW